MLPFDGQNNWKAAYKWIVKFIKAIEPKKVITMKALAEGNSTFIRTP